MAFSEKEKRHMCRLAKEGKQISQIVAQDFPGADYWEVYDIITNGGEQSIQGVKKRITARLKKLINATKEERRALVEEIKDLIWYLYDSQQANQKKLSKIRKALDE